MAASQIKIKLTRIINRLHLIWHRLRCPIVDEEVLLREIGEIGHHVTQLQSYDIEKDSWTIRRLRNLLYQAVLQNIWNETVAWGLKIWAGAVDKDIPADHRFSPEINSNAVIEIIRKRQSIRSFDERPVPDEIVRVILESAINAPCSCNRQTWRFLILNKRDDIKYIAEIRKSKWVEKAGTIILIFCDLSRYRESGGERKYTPYLDAGAAIENMLIAATASGIASCWVNCGPYEIDDDARQKTYRRFALEENLLWTGIVVLGYAVKSFPKPPRALVTSYFLERI